MKAVVLLTTNSIISHRSTCLWLSKAVTLSLPSCSQRHEYLYFVSSFLMFLFWGIYGSPFVWTNNPTYVVSFLFELRSCRINRMSTRFPSIQRSTLVNFHHNGDRNILTFASINTHRIATVPRALFLIGKSPGRLTAKKSHWPASRLGEGMIVLMICHGQNDNMTA